MAVELPRQDEVEQAWRKARPLPGHDPGLYRIAPDIIQSVIRRDRYDICGDYGWRIEHGRPVAYRKSSLEEAMKLLQHETQMPRPQEHTRTTRSRKT